MKIKNKNIGMTLLELLIVIGIITIMASMIFIATRSGWVDANTKLTQHTISMIDGALEDYRENNTSGLSFPNPDALATIADFNSPLNLYQYETSHSASLYAQLNMVPDVRKVLERFDNSQINLEKALNKYPIFFDAWGTVLDYRYVAGVNSFPVIVSAGPDKDFTKTDDNITNRK